MAQAGGRWEKIARLRNRTHWSASLPRRRDEPRHSLFDKNPISFTAFKAVWGDMDHLFSFLPPGRCVAK